MKRMLDKAHRLEESKIRQARTASGFSMEQLAVEAGISLSTLRMAERGWYSEATLEKLAQTLNVTPDSLRKETG